MAVTLQRLFADCKRNYDIDLVAGANGMKNLVRWVHIVEDSEVPSFLHGNELIFTTGIAAGDNFDYITFAKSLIYHGSAGWVINIGPYIPSIPDELIKFCNENQFPLFTIPWKMRLIDVTYDYSHKIIENEEKELSVAKSFSNLIFHMGQYDENVENIERCGFDLLDKFNIIYTSGIKDGNKITTDMIHQTLFSIESKMNIVNKICMFVESDSLITIISNASKDEVDDCINKLKTGIKDEYGEVSLSIGISDQYEGYDSLDKAYKQAHIASKSSHMMKKEVLHYGECGIYELIYLIDDIDLEKRYVEDVLGEIINYDKKHNSNYLEILKMYIEYDSSVQEISNILGVHRNTINYKVKFIKSNFNIELDMKSCAKLWLAFAIKEIIENN